MALFSHDNGGLRDLYFQSLRLSENILEGKAAQHPHTPSTMQEQPRQDSSACGH